MIRRLAVAAVIGAAATFGVLSLMMALVTREAHELEDVETARVVDFVRLRRSVEPEVKPRELPNQAQPEKPPPPPEIEMSDVPQPSSLEVAAAIPAVETSLELSGGAGFGDGTGASSDADVVPLVRVSPQYPPRAMQRGIEGWVQVRFTITQAGTVTNETVVRAEPENYFEQAALNAVRKYRYKPKIEQGKPIERPGVELIIAFRLER